MTKFDSASDFRLVCRCNDHCNSFDQTKRSNVSLRLKPYTLYIPLSRQNEMVLTDPEPSINVSRKLTKPRAECMDLTDIRTDKNKTQSTNQGADYAVLHPSTRSWEVERDHVTIEKIIGKGAFGRVAKGTAVELRGRPGTTTVAIKMLKGKALFRLYSSLGKTLK